MSDKRAALEALATRRDTVSAELDDINAQITELILWHHADDRSMRWIAERAGVSHQTVANIIKRAKG